MKIIAEGESIVIRKMEARAEDFQLFLRWMTDPETMKYWEGMTEHFTYERVVKSIGKQRRRGRSSVSLSTISFRSVLSILSGAKCSGL